METLEKNDIESQVMGMSGEDIVLSPAAKKIIPYSFECKNVEKLNIWNALEQAETNCEGRTPVLVFKRNRSKTYVVIEFDAWIKHIGGNSESVPKGSTKSRNGKDDGKSNYSTRTTRS